MLRTVLRLATLLLVLQWPAAADAQIYRWVDDNGVPHYADGIDSVPDRLEIVLVGHPARVY